MQAGHGDQRWTAQDELILRAAERLRRGLRRHPLHGLLQFDELRYTDALDAVLAEFDPAAVPLSIVLADLDQFGVINDNFGLEAGDEALEAVGHALRALIRPLDMVMTSGTDAYLVILLGADLRVALSRAEEFRAHVKQLDLRRVPTGVTASFGVAAHTGSETAVELFERAFAAEQEAKRLGRDRVEPAPAPDATGSGAPGRSTGNPVPDRRGGITATDRAPGGRVPGARSLLVGGTTRGPS